jgi:hypothetical protein
MPKSRKRPRPKRRRKNPRLNPLALEGLFDRVAEAPHAGAPPVLFHYTTWEGARGIIASQRFWATTHDCTNDEAELVSADDVIIDVAKDLLKHATGAAAEVLRRFIEGYASLQVTRLITVCIACFSVARDDEAQWRKYGDDGRGVCLGIRVLDEPGPEGSSAALVKVDYSESSWRSGLAKHFSAVCSLLDRAEPTRRNFELGLSALHRLAAFASIGAKRAEWAVEQEFREVTLVPKKSQIRLLERQGADGEVKRYLPVQVRADGKRIAFSEIIIGSNRNTEESREQLKGFLAKQGYKIADLEYPEITVSAIPPWDVARR